MLTRTSKEFIEMKKSIAKHYLELCEHAYKETEQRRAFEYPEWINSIKNDKTNAQESFVAMQSALLMLAHKQGELLNDYPAMGLCKEMPLADFFSYWVTLIAMGAEIETYSPLKSACENLAEYAKYVQSNFKEHETKERYSYKSLHELATEALQREAASVTPCDVSEFMLLQAGAVEKVDVYGLDGLGLIYAVRDKTKANIVGDDFGKSDVRVWPDSLKTINKDALTWYKKQEFANKEFLELEWKFSEYEMQGDVLLVNAARADVPFLNADEENDQQAGSLNNCLTAGYKKVVVLVSNHYLTAGRGMAEQILSYCLKHGLRKVIQLPMGVLGFKSQQHSILVFEQGVNNESVEFIDLSSEENTRTAPKGFGEPRRAKVLKSNGDGYWGPSYHALSTTVEVNSLRKNSRSGSKKLLSFEVGQFLKTDPIKELRDTYTFMRLQEFMDVFRAHHIEETGEDVRVSYAEVGANCISDLGWIGQGRKRECAATALDKRKAQILKDKDIVLCFRGAPDSFGKAGFYRKQAKEIAIPNQSFVILRAKEDGIANAPTPELVMWWIRSHYAQEYLKQKSISPDVVRIAPKDIAGMDVPCGPDHLIAAELIKIQEVNETLIKVHQHKQAIAKLELDSWPKR
jgi:hypothetical protein